MTPPFKVNNPGIQRVLDDPSASWTALRNLPGVRSWRILSDSLFLATSFPLGLVWFLVGVIGLSIGFGLSVIGVGLPVLAATFAIMWWGANVERSRVRIFLDVNIPSPFNSIESTGNVLQRAWMYIRSPQIWRDIAYLMLLLPIGIVELILVAIPFGYLFAPFAFTVFGSHQMSFWEINSLFESLVAFVFGLVLIVPLSIAINLAAIMHGRIAVRFLSTSNEELLIERVEELTESRSAVMRAMHLERRRIERDLHDGAQQRLVNLAMDLGRAREKMEWDPEASRRIIEESHEQAKQVLTEMRDLIRGIHPAVLTDRGLDAAVSAIAGRSPVPVQVDVRLRERLPEEVEGTAYFVVVEALTNIARHSGATQASVDIRREGNWLRIGVSDNGLGGANPELGTGLRGLRDRITALDGRIALSSPKGKGTRLTVEIPCG